MQTMIVLVEGPDGTGKTTLSKVFQDKYKYTYIHLGPCADIEETYKDLIDQLIECRKNGENVVIDRAIISNYVYSKVFKGTMLGPVRAAQFVELVDEMIMCLPADKQAYLDEFNKLQNEREELYNDMNTVYDEFSQFHTPFVYDRFKENAEEYVDRFIQSNRQ